MCTYYLLSTENLVERALVQFYEAVRLLRIYLHHQVNLRKGKGTLNYGLLRRGDTVAARVVPWAFTTGPVSYGYAERVNAASVRLSPELDDVIDDDGEEEEGEEKENADGADDAPSHVVGEVFVPIPSRIVGWWSVKRPPRRAQYGHWSAFWLALCSENNSMCRHMFRVLMDVQGRPGGEQFGVPMDDAWPLTSSIAAWWQRHGSLAAYLFRHRRSLIYAATLRRRHDDWIGCLTSWANTFWGVGPNDHFDWEADYHPRAWAGPIILWRVFRDSAMTLDARMGNTRDTYERLFRSSVVWLFNSCSDEELSWEELTEKYGPGPASAAEEGQRQLLSFVNKGRAVSTFGIKDRNFVSKPVAWMMKEFADAGCDPYAAGEGAASKASTVRAFMDLFPHPKQQFPPYLFLPAQVYHPSAEDIWPRTRDDVVPSDDKRPFEEKDEWENPTPVPFHVGLPALPGDELHVERVASNRGRKPKGDTPKQQAPRRPREPPSAACEGDLRGVAPGTVVHLPSSKRRKEVCISSQVAGAASSSPSSPSSAAPGGASSSTASSSSSSSEPGGVSTSTASSSSSSSAAPGGASTSTASSSSSSSASALGQASSSTVPRGEYQSVNQFLYGERFSGILLSLVDPEHAPEHPCPAEWLVPIRTAVVGILELVKLEYRVRQGSLSDWIVNYAMETLLGANPMFYHDMVAAWATDDNMKKKNVTKEPTSRKRGSEKKEQCEEKRPRKEKKEKKEDEGGQTKTAPRGRWEKLLEDDDDDDEEKDEANVSPEVKANEKPSDGSGMCIGEANFLLTMF